VTDPESSRSRHEDDFGGFFAVVSTYLHDMNDQRRTTVVRVGGRRIRDGKVIAMVEEAARAEDERTEAVGTQEPQPSRPDGGGEHPKAEGQPHDADQPHEAVSAILWLLLGGGVGLLLVAAVDRLMR
jgi:hypothetical protein